jgi:hypothetical protein
MHNIVYSIQVVKYEVIWINIGIPIYSFSTKLYSKTCRVLGQLKTLINNQNYEFKTILILIYILI